MENSMEASKKIENGTTIWSSKFTFGYLSGIWRKHPLWRTKSSWPRERNPERERLQTFCLLSFSLLPQLKLKMKLQGKGTQIVAGAGQTSRQKSEGLLLLLLLTLTIPSTWLSIYIFLHAPWFYAYNSGIVLMKVSLISSNILWVL